MMMSSGVRRIEPPGGSSHPRYLGATLLDSFAIRLPASAPDDARRLAELALRDPPIAFRVALRLRDTVMARFGIKTSDQLRGRRDGRERIDFFPIRAVSPREIEIGEDDRHLDFRTWLTIVDDGDARLLLSTTAAFAHNRLGRLYLTLIRPFHVAIVAASLRRAVRRLLRSG